MKKIVKWLILILISVIMLAYTPIYICAQNYEKYYFVMAPKLILVIVYPILLAGSISLIHSMKIS